MCANIAVFGGESYGHAQLEIECLKGSFLWMRLETRINKDGRRFYKLEKTRDILDNSNTGKT